MPADLNDFSAPRNVTSMTSEGSILKTLLRLTEQNRLDVTAELYNEALDLANQSDLPGARARLQVLLGLYPSDGDAHLLMARVHVAASQWRLALIDLQSAAACNATIPDHLQSMVERHVQAESSWSEDRAAREDRENGELKKLRGDVRKLRGENAQLAALARSTEKESSRWAWVAAGTSTVAILFIVGRMLIGGADVAPTQVAAKPAVVAGATEAADALVEPAIKPTGTIGSIRDPDLGKVANDALTAAGVADGLKVVVRGTSAQITGSAKNNKQMQDAIRAVQGTPGITKVAADSVINVAMRDGATHVVAAGDTLSKIAVEYYGSASLHDKILAANPELGPKGALHVGGTIRIPAVEQP